MLCLTPWASPLFAIFLGAIVSLTLTNPYPNVSRKLSEWLLETSVVLLGFGMTLAVILNAMAASAFLSSSVVICTLLVGLLLGKVLGINGREAALISAGTAICGGTAIVAVGAIVKAEDEDITVAIGTVSLLNTAALYLFPVVGHALQLNQHQFGVWAGVSIHDVSSVVAAGDVYGQNAIQIATAVKLTRVMWMLPLTLGLSLLMRAKAKAKKVSSEIQAQQNSAWRIHVPWFVGIFLLACFVTKIVPGVQKFGPLLTRFGEAGLTLTFFLMGTNISRQTLKALGWRAVTHGLILWLCVSLVTLFVVRHG